LVTHIDWKVRSISAKHAFAIANPNHARTWTLPVFIHQGTAFRYRAFHVAGSRSSCSCAMPWLNAVRRLRWKAITVRFRPLHYSAAGW